MPEQSKSVWPVVRVASGNFLEMYDFQVFGYYAAAIGLKLFPERKRVRLADAGVGDFRCRLSDAAARRPRPWVRMDIAGAVMGFC